VAERPPGAAALGAAVIAMLARQAAAPPPANRTIKQQLAYLTAVKTGATEQAVARRLRTQPATLKRWRSGATMPNPAHRASISEEFRRTWNFNNRYQNIKKVQNAKIRVSGTPLGTITIQNHPRGSILAENDRRRTWLGIQRATDDLEAYDEFVSGILAHSPLPPIQPDYLWFHIGNYSVTKA
jgi:hypothetical protein